MYDFDSKIDRHNTNSVKWSGAQDRYKNPDILPMWVADMDFASPKEVIESLKNTATNEIFGYSLPPTWNKELLKSVRLWIKRRNEWDISFEQLGFSSGVIPALSFAIKATTAENDAIILQSPYYGHFKTLLDDTHRKLINNPLIQNEYGYELDLDDFEQKIVDNNVKAFILCNPHNPTGRVWSENELISLAKICEKHDVWILSDDIHSDLIMPGYNYQPLAKIFKQYADHIITFKSVSKTFNLAGIQSAYYISENLELLEKMKKIRDESFNPELLNSFATPAIISAYSFGDSWLKSVIKYIESNYNFADNFIHTELPKAKVANLEATYLVWIDVSYLNISEEQLLKHLDDAGLGVETSSEFGLTDPHKLFIRMNIATQRENVELGLKRLKEALS
ncbi:aminotransferase [Companilactobacillus sp. RD055328]|uniref:MalY/PatB family protein n=1 Tax=Companilactobacillus sp. RD055328 TaxID=2916634 RepID=UPI001FC8E17F|nr:PatB family C-S lyase [Companilactobacillus sp. RD055328]GKQ43007.1 aminotransferase [Companilactobacillus sp. RD055328]